MTYAMALTANSTSEPMAQARCVWSILIASGSFRAGLAEHLAEELAWIHAVRGVVRAGVDAARLFQVRAEVAGSCLLLDRRFLPAGIFGIVGKNFERVQVDVAVRAIASAQAATDAPVLDDDFERIAAANGPHRAADHAEGVAALAAGSGDEVVIEAQAVADEARDAV